MRRHLQWAVYPVNNHFFKKNGRLLARSFGCHSVAMELAALARRVSHALCAAADRALVLAAMLARRVRQACKAASRRTALRLASARAITLPVCRMMNSNVVTAPPYANETIMSTTSLL